MLVQACLPVIPGGVETRVMLQSSRFGQPERLAIRHGTRPTLSQFVTRVLPGRQLTGDERAALAACLHVPAEAALAITSTVQICNAEPLTGWDFVDLAAHTGGTPATARWDTGSVLATVAHLLDRVLAQLPFGHVLLLCGRAELVRAV